MLVMPDGGGSVTPPPSHTAPLADPKVDAAVDATVQSAKNAPAPDKAVAYQIKETMENPDLTQAEKDEYIARLIETTNRCPSGDVDQRTIDGVRKAFEDIGEAWTGDETPQLRDEVTAAIAHVANDNRITADDLYQLVSADKNPNSDGARQLLTGISNGTMLDRVANQLLSDAKREGYDINKYQKGPELLVAAADIGNMAAVHGNVSADNAILKEIGRQTKEGPVAGDMTQVQAMMATTLNGSYGSAVKGRTGFDALSGLLNGAYSFEPDLQPIADNLFATLVRSGDDGYAGGLDQSGDRSSALYDLGTYFNSNLSRLNENGWRYDSSGQPGENLVQDFTSKVLLDDDYPLKEFTTDAISSEMNSLAGVINDPHASAKDRSAAATGLGELVGSIKAGANDYFEHAKGDEDAKIGAIRFFADKITDKLADAAGPFGDIVKAGVDAGWGAYSDHVEDGINDKVEDALGDLEDQSNALRVGLGHQGDPDLINDYDQRYTEHVPD